MVKEILKYRFSLSFSVSECLTIRWHKIPSVANTTSPLIQSQQFNTHNITTLDSHSITKQRTVLNPGVLHSLLLSILHLHSAPHFISSFLFQNISSLENLKLPWHFFCSYLSLMMDHKTSFPPLANGAKRCLCEHAVPCLGHPLWDCQVGIKYR